MGVEFFQAFAEIVVEPSVGAAIAGGLGGFVVILEQPLSVGECAIDFPNLSGRQIKYFGLDVRSADFALLYFWSVFPESGGFSEPVVFDDHPFEFSQRCAFELGVQRCGGILPDAKHSLDSACVHRDEHRHVRMVAENLWMPVPAELVLLGRRLAIDGLKIRNYEFRHIRPIAGR